jgi:hypothetical protein
MGSRTLPGELCSHLGGRRGLGAKIAEKEKTLHRVRQQLAKRNQELARLWSRLTRAETTRHSSSLSRGNTQVFFLLGRARSGTTWLRSILNSHPEILCWGEGRFFERSFKREDLEQSQVRNITPSSLYGAMLDSK